MADEDYYKVLGVARDASPAEVRKAYKKIVRENHPDMKPDDKQAAERFKQAQDAYSVLGDAEKRKQYDQFGHTFRGGGPFPGGGGRTYSWGGGGPGGGGAVDIEELFGGGGFDIRDLFGGGGGRGYRGTRQAPPVKGADLRIEIQVPFHVAALGGKHDMHLSRDGRPETITAKIPAGIEDGSVIRLAGQGEPGPAGAGDLLVTVRVALHPYFRREKNDIHLDVPVTPTEAALGAKVEVPTLDEGPVVVTIPEGSSSGRKLRLREKGIVDRKSGKRGDQYVVVKVVVPPHPNDEARDLFTRLAKAQPFDPRAGSW
ncbi:MAG: J domain-containing protein [Planctomycetaceae bacterium]